MFLASLGKTQLAHHSRPFCVCLNLPKAAEKPTKLMQVAISWTSGAQGGCCYCVHGPQPSFCSPSSRQTLATSSCISSATASNEKYQHHDKSHLGTSHPPLPHQKGLKPLHQAHPLTPASAPAWALTFYPASRSSQPCRSPSAERQTTRGPGLGAGLCSGDPTQPPAGAPRALPGTQAFALLVRLPWTASPNPTCHLLILFNF